MPTIHSTAVTEEIISLAMGPEKTIEQAFRKAVIKEGGVAWKLTCPGTIGVPDRLVIFPGHITFVETKRPGAKPRETQLVVHRLLRSYGFPVIVLDNLEDIPKTVKQCKEGNEKCPYVKTENTGLLL